MNDPFETAVLTNQGLSKRLFYTCFTKVPESLAMYKLYGIDKNSVIIKISYSDLAKFITENNISNDHYSTVRQMKILRNNQSTNKYVSGELFFTAIGYIDPRSKELRTGTSINSHIKKPFLSSELAGKVKYNCWEYEEEVRLCAQLASDLDDNECLSVKVPENFDSMISIILCPGFDRVKNKRILMDLRMRDIDCQASVYDPLYTDFLSGKQIDVEYTEENISDDLEQQIIDMVLKGETIRNISNRYGVTSAYVNRRIRECMSKGEIQCISDGGRKRYVKPNGMKAPF